MIHRIMLLIAVGPALAACGFADSRAPLPDFMRAKAADPPPPEAAPDVRQLVRDNLDSIFVSTSNPRQVQVTEPHRDPRGLQWTACVRADVNSAVGTPVGAQTYRLFISGGMIVDRRRADADDNCSSGIFAPI
ncbi:MAG: hypothetical protein HY852_20840 [Bradyrhizobium sp.]|uniref:hypothetical protein n=1 Tax=Bradyrhizobium sp. TaxID=376 RepID=UPI0025BBC9D3|nr:hypothetical protein [Bradyrhizobium sp.]MBI5264257.1 hypothetical protein [Bradyrhizobium sp.]